jgi:hypothetical protein
MKHRTIRIENKPKAVQRFFEQIGQEPVIIEREGVPLCVLYPAARLSYIPEGDLKDAAGSWNIPEDMARAIVGEQTEGSDLR